MKDVLKTAQKNKVKAVIAKNIKPEVVSVVTKNQKNAGKSAEVNLISEKSKTKSLKKNDNGKKTSAQVAETLAGAASSKVKKTAQETQNIVKVSREVKSSLKNSGKKERFPKHELAVKSVNDLKVVGKSKAALLDKDQKEAKVQKKSPSASVAPSVEKVSKSKSIPGSKAKGVIVRELDESTDKMVGNNIQSAKGNKKSKSQAETAPAVSEENAEMTQAHQKKMAQIEKKKANSGKKVPSKLKNGVPQAGEAKSPAKIKIDKDLLNLSSRPLGEIQKKWSEFKDKYGKIQAPVYNMSGSYQAAAPLQHKVLGWGFVISIENDRLEVIFESGSKTLISNYRPR